MTDVMALNTQALW